MKVANLHYSNKLQQYTVVFFHYVLTMNFCSGKGFTTEDRVRFKELIWKNMVESMKTLIEYATDYGTAGLSAKAQRCKEELLQSETLQMTEANAKLLSRLWKVRFYLRTMPYIVMFHPI